MTMGQPTSRKTSVRNPQTADVFVFESLLAKM